MKIIRRIMFTICFCILAFPLLADTNTNNEERDNLENSLNNSSDDDTYGESREKKEEASKADGVSATEEFEQESGFQTVD